MNTFYKSFGIAFFFIGAVGLAPFSHAEEYSLSYGARLTEASGAPILGQDGKLDLEVSFYNVGSGGSPIGPGPISFPGTSVAEGIFQLSITLAPTEFHQVFQDPSTPVYIEVKDVKSGAVFPRQRFSVIPFALKTPIDDDTIVYNSDGKLTVGSNVGTVKQITAGSGLNGGSITDSGTITVDTGTTGNKIVQLSDGKLPSVDGSNLSSVNAEKLQTRNVSAAVPASGQVLKWSGSAWVPSSDLVGETGSGEANTASSVTSGSGVGLFKAKVSADLQFYSLSSGAGVTVNLVGDDVVVASTITQYTDAMAKAAAVADSITDSVTTIAPSQNAVFDALATKQASVTTSTDLNLNSITTNAVNAITVNPGVSTGEIKLKELSANGANYVGLKAPGSVTSDLTLTLPGSAGTNGQFLKTDGSGNLSWTDQASAPVSSVNTLTGAVTLTTTNINEGTNLYYTDARAKTAAVGDAITDAVTDKAPSQNAVFDALALKSEASHNHTGVYEPAGLSTDVVTTTKILNGAVTSAKIANLGIETANINTGAVTAAKIAACSDTQILKMSGATNWVCSSDANSGGTVTSVASGTGITGGPITGTGTLSLATSGVTAGTYTKVTVDTYGRATSGTSIAAGDLPNSIDAAKIGGGAVSNTEFGYLDGVTSAIQTQLNGQVVGSASAIDNAIARFDGTTGKLVQNSGVVIDDSGHVGIGTLTPGAALAVEGSGTANEDIIRVNNQGSYASRIWLRNSNQSAYLGISGAVADTNPGTGALPYALTVGIGNTSPIQFWNSTGTAGTNSVKMTINSNGNVGIGTTSPNTMLSVGGALSSTGYWLGSYLSNAVSSVNTASVGGVGAIHLEGNRNSGAASADVITFRNIQSTDTTKDRTIAAISATTNTSYSTNAGNLGFYTHDTSTGFDERMRIDSSGNVGIGTTSPTTKLDVNGGVKVNGSAVGIGATTRNCATSAPSGTSSPITWLAVHITPTPATTPALARTNFRLGSTSDLSLEGEIYFDGYSWGSNGPINDFRLTGGDRPARWSDGLQAPRRVDLVRTSFLDLGSSRQSAVLMLRLPAYTTNQYSRWWYYNFVFSDDPGATISNCAVITADNPTIADFNTAFGVNGNSINSSVDFSLSSSFADGLAFLNGNVGIGTTSPTQKLQVGTSGDGSVALANAWNTFSDIRLKRDLVKLPEALNKLEELNGYYYFWKEGEDQDRQVGVIAQEVEQVLPELVKTGQDGIKTVDYPKLTVLLIEAAKQLKADAENLKTDKDRDIARLDAENSELKIDAEKKDEDILQLKADNEAIKAFLCQTQPQGPFCKR